jgi:uncharacterized protein (TIGR02246 family)
MISVPRRCVRVAAPLLMGVIATFFLAAEADALQDHVARSTNPKGESRAAAYDGTGHGSPTSPAEVECMRMTAVQALESVRRAYMDAFNSGDAEAVAALHTEGSVSMPGGLPMVTGREAIRDIMQASLSAMPPGLRFEFEPVDIRITDGWAVERGVTKAAPPFPAGKYVMLYEQEPDGCWRIAWTITNSDAPPLPR